MSNDIEGNNAFGHSLNPGKVMHRNFRHRSLVETYITEALFLRGFLFTPLTVFSNGQRRIEVDFLIIKDGVCLILEIDSEEYHHETMLEAENRLQSFRENFIDVLREPIPHDAGLSWAHRIVDKVQDMLWRKRFQGYQVVGELMIPRPQPYGSIIPDEEKPINSDVELKESDENDDLPF